MKKKILIAGGNYGDIPILKEAKKLGFYVITSGNKEDDLGHSVSDKTCLVDFSDKDAVLKLAKELQIDFIVPSCHDLSMVTCSYVAEKLGLAGYDSYETTLNIHHKDRFKSIARHINLKTPLSFSCSTVDEARRMYNKISLPVVVKPVDLGGGRGISIVKNRGYIDKSIKIAFNASKIGKIVVEEFFEGSLHSFSTFIKNKKIVFYYADNEFSSVNPYGVSLSTSPAAEFDNIKNILIEETEKLAEELNLSNGLLHMQYLMNNRNISIIEFTRRTPGDWYNIPVELSTGVNYSYWVLQSFISGNFSSLKHKNQNGFYSRYCLMSDRNGLIKNIYIDKTIKDNIIDSFLWTKRSKMVSDFKYQKFGLFFLKYSSAKEMMSKSKNITSLIKLEIEK